MKIPPENLKVVQNAPSAQYIVFISNRASLLVLHRPILVQVFVLFGNVGTLVLMLVLLILALKIGLSFYFCAAYMYLLLFLFS